MTYDSPVKYSLYNYSRVGYPLPDCSRVQSCKVSITRPQSSEVSCWYINTNAIGVNVQVYTTSNKLMSIQDRLHRD